MRNMVKIFTVLALAVFFIGCEQFIYNYSYNVSVYNNNGNKYLTGLYFRTYDYGNNGWSRNQVYYDLRPWETFNIVFDEGTYDFEIELEDEEYIYTIHEEGVPIYNDMVLDVCYDCDMQKGSTKITKKPKTLTSPETNQKYR